MSITSFRNGIILLMIFNVIDALYTLAWIQNGLAVEANPIMDSALSIGPGTFILVKVLMVSLGLTLLWRLRETTFARMALIIPAVFYSAIIGTHIAHSIRLGFGLY
jgi:hypothetical protein